jgi:CMP-N,N'-diacetyllegionaminic acid synthase
MLAVIPARGGSKGIPDKNIKSLCGKPLIYYTIEAALAAKTIDRIILSTDDPGIAQAACQYGIESPFMRPKELAQDNSLAIDTYIYTIDRLNAEFDGQYEEFVVLLPTSPLRTARDIENAIELFYDKNADSVISCVALHHPLEWIFRVGSNGAISRNKKFDEKMIKNRQEAETVYVPNGAVNVLKNSLLKEKRSYYFDNTYAYIMSRERSVDIDSMADFDYAEYLMRK